MTTSAEGSLTGVLVVGVLVAGVPVTSDAPQTDVGNVGLGVTAILSPGPVSRRRGQDRIAPRSNCAGTCVELARPGRREWLWRRCRVGSAGSAPGQAARRDGACCVHRGCRPP